MRRLLTLALLSLILFSSRESSAFHTEKDRQTDFSAYTLQQGQFRVGLFQLEAGLFDWWTVGTYTMPWLLMPVARSFNGSLYTKLKFVDTGSLAVAFRPSVFYLSFHDLSVGDLEDGDFDSFIMPLILTGSYVINDAWTVSAEATWVQTHASGDAQSVDQSSALGALSESNLQFAAYGEYRLSRVVAFNLLARYVPYITDLNLSTNATVDDATSVSLQANAALDAKQPVYLLQGGVALSWKTFNLQFGLGYGNVILPGVRIASAEKFIMPDFDLYWRF